VTNRKVLLIISGALLVCLLICCSVVFFGGRSLRSGLNNNIEDGIGTVVAERFSVNGVAAPGTYVITQDELLDRITTSLNDSNTDVDNLVVQINPDNEIVIGFKSQSQDLTYTGTVAAVDGRFDVQKMELNGAGSLGSVINIVLPGGKIAGAIEKGVNSYLAQNNLKLDSVTSEAGKLTLVVVPA
jgi:hypothetical protein